MNIPSSRRRVDNLEQEIVVAAADQQDGGQGAEAVCQRLLNQGIAAPR